jgi:hypothetical protein
MLPLAFKLRSPTDTPISRIQITPPTPPAERVQQFSPQVSVERIYIDNGITIVRQDDQYIVVDPTDFEGHLYANYVYQVKIDLGVRRKA